MEIQNSRPYLIKTILDIWNELPLILGIGVFLTLIIILSWVVGLFFHEALAVFTFVISFFPFVSGALYVLGMVARGFGSNFRDLFLAAKKSYCRSIGLGFVVLLPYSLLFGTSGIISLFPNQKWLWLSLAIQGSMSIMVTFISIHAFSIVALYNLSIKKSIICACIIVLHAPLETLGIISLLYLFSYAIYWSRFGLLPLLIGVWFMFLANLNYMAGRKISGNNLINAIYKS